MADKDAKPQRVVFGQQMQGHGPKVRVNTRLKFDFG
jgi:hypothetical protein